MCAGEVRRRARVSYMAVTSDERHVRWPTTARAGGGGDVRQVSMRTWPTSQRDMSDASILTWSTSDSAPAETGAHLRHVRLAASLTCDEAVFSPKKAEKRSIQGVDARRRARSVCARVRRRHLWEEGSAPLVRAARGELFYPGRWHAREGWGGKGGGGGGARLSPRPLHHGLRPCTARVVLALDRDRVIAHDACRARVRFVVRSKLITGRASVSEPLADL